MTRGPYDYKYPLHVPRKGDGADALEQTRDEKATEKFLALLEQHHRYGAGELRMKDAG
jgi:hypothetical protein